MHNDAQKPRDLSLLVSPNEHWLLLALRKRFQNGEVVIVMRNGVVQYIKEAWRSEAPPRD